MFFGFIKKSDFQGGCLQKTNIEGEDYLKRAAWTVYRFNGGTWLERGGDVFEGEG